MQEIRPIPSETGEPQLLEIHELATDEEIPRSIYGLGFKLPEEHAKAARDAITRKIRAEAVMAGEDEFEIPEDVMEAISKTTSTAMVGDEGPIYICWN